MNRVVLSMSGLWFDLRNTQCPNALNTMRMPLRLLLHQRTCLLKTLIGMLWFQQMWQRLGLETWLQLFIRTRRLLKMHAMRLAVLATTSRLFQIIFNDNWCTSNSSRVAKICWCIVWKMISPWRFEQMGLLTFGRKLLPLDGCSLGTCWWCPLSS
jgi:hypothetical protein